MAKNSKVSIIVPVFNQVEYTKKCFESILADVERIPTEIIVVDNASTDGTSQYLESFQNSLPSDVEFKMISNATNLGVAPAWNQGLRAATTDQLLVINNDILASQGWIQGMWWGQNQFNLDLVCPFAIHGELNYDLQKRAVNFVKRNSKRMWDEYSFCAFLMPRNTYAKIGEFDEAFKVGGYEDTDYCYRIKKAHMRYGIVGSSFIHHFGSVTLGEFKRAGDQHVGPNRQYFIEKWGEDPAEKAAKFTAKMRRSVRRIKMRLDWM